MERLKLALMMLKVMINLTVLVGWGLKTKRLFSKVVPAKWTECLVWYHFSYLSGIASSKENTLACNKIIIHHCKTKIYALIISDGIKWAKFQGSSMILQSKIRLLGWHYSMMPKVWNKFKIDEMDIWLFLSILALLPRFHIYYRRYRTINSIVFEHEMYISAPRD